MLWLVGCKKKTTEVLKSQNGASEASDFVAEAISGNGSSGHLGLTCCLGDLPLGILRFLNRTLCKQISSIFLPEALGIRNVPMHRARSTCVYKSLPLRVSAHSSASAWGFWSSSFVQADIAIFLPEALGLASRSHSLSG